MSSCDVLRKRIFSARNSTVISGMNKIEKNLLNAMKPYINLKIKCNDSISNQTINRISSASTHYTKGKMTLKESKSSYL
jgi:hypothetical protein